jgi:two-component system chemotaxis response regulator CheY
MAAVLVVDDSDTMRQLVRAMLEPLGYAVHEAEDGVQGMSALRAAAEPGVVLLDYRMPNMDGWEVLQQVVADGAPLTAHQYIVITADVSTFPTAYIELLRDVSIRILPKPFSKDGLTAAVSQAISRLSEPAAVPVAIESDSGQTV